MKKNFDNLYEKLGGTYHEENGHLIPDIALPEQTDYQIGKYGRMHLVCFKVDFVQLSVQLTFGQERGIPSATVLLDVIKVHPSIFADMIVGLFGKGYVRNKVSVFLAVCTTEFFIKIIEVLFHFRSPLHLIFISKYCNGLPLCL